MNCKYYRDTFTIFLKTKVFNSLQNRLIKIEE
jgi:hypothetical protein